MNLSIMTFGGIERTVRQWRELLGGDRLDVVSLDPPQSAGSLTKDGLIVATLKKQIRIGMVG